MQIAAPRLTLLAATPRHLATEMVSPQRLGKMLGAVVSPDWPPGEYDQEAMAYFRDRLLVGGRAVAGWYAWYAIRREEGRQPAELIGSGGFFGPPDGHGTVEVGYSVLPAWRRQGYASEMTTALATFALGRPGVRRVIAHTADDNEASMAVLRRCGFIATGAGESPGTRRFELISG
ncbi:MAG: GNAT family N-acetyltransferase [Acidobacteria bacterium]|nr:GNAT family N-acetyltransferase [Acidobacteriota bacterium]